jgi:hypothetical protein
MTPRYQVNHREHIPIRYRFRSAEHCKENMAFLQIPDGPWESDHAA